MAPVESLARKPSQPAAAYRSAPPNTEAEQALLGAILVNNEAFYRVSDFLNPEHFFEPIHERIFGLARELIRAGKIATPVTLQTFLDASIDIGGLTVTQYLARLAAEATTIINAEDYGRTIYDLFLRRSVIPLGEDMVNVAYDAPVDFSPRHQIEDAERKLYDLAESGKYDGGFQRFANALTTAIDMAAHAFQRDGQLSGIATGLDDLDRMMGGLQSSDLIILARDQYRLQHRQGLARRGETGRAHPHRQRRRGRLLLARNVGGTARDAHHRRADGNSLEQDPPRQHHRVRVREDKGLFDRIAEPAALCRRDRRHLGRAARRARAPAQAPARARRDRHRPPEIPVRP